MSDHNDPLNGTPPPRKRRRPAKSCEQCRRRKVRCDQNMPCGPCARSRSSLSCSYGAAVDATVYGSPDRGYQVLNDVGALGTTPTLSSSTRTAQPQRQEEAGSSGTGCNQNQAQSSVLSPGAASHNEQALRDIQRRLQRLEERLSSREISQCSSTTVDGLPIPGTLPRLRVTPDKTRMFGKSHWLQTADEFQLIGKLDMKDLSFNDARAELSDIIKARNDCRDLRQSMKTQQSVKLNNPVPDLLSTLPTRTVCDELINRYLWTFEHIFRVVHIPSFFKDYHQFWERPHSASTQFLMKLVLILAIGATFYPNKDSFEHIRHSAQTWIYAAQWWLTGPSEKSTKNLDGLQVFCLLLLARQTNSLGVSTCVSAESLLKMAMTMGLHYDPRHFPALSVFQAEMRRRLWATVVELNLQSSLNSAVPLLLSVHDYDTQPPSNLNDEDMGPNITNFSTARPSSGYTEASIQILLSKSLQLRVEVARLVNNFSLGRNYDTALKLGSGLRTASREVAAFFDSDFTDYLGRDLRSRTFHRRFLDTYLSRYVLLLHRPLMLQSRSDPRYYLSRKICLESAMAIASYADDLDIPSDKTLHDDFSRLTIYGAGLFRGPLSLDVITVLGLELVTQLEEEASTRPFNASKVANDSDTLDHMAKENREPIIKKLENILNQLLQIIGLGNPSLKRYNFLAAMLAQIQAMESGQCARTAVYEALKLSLRDCYSMLQESYATSMSQTPVPTLTDETQSGTGIPSDFDFDSLDLNFGLDIPSLLYFPGFAEGSNFEL